MNTSFVVLAYNVDLTLLGKVEEGPVNRIVDFFYDKAVIKLFKNYFNKVEIKHLTPFDLEKHGLEIEDVDGWEDPIFLKGKRSPILFLDAIRKLQDNLEQLLNTEDFLFYKKPMHDFITGVEKLFASKTVKYITFYDLYA